VWAWCSNGDGHDDSIMMMIVMSHSRIPTVLACREDWAAQGWEMVFVGQRECESILEESFPRLVRPGDAPEAAAGLAR
jgi:hypothetical protein